MRNKTNNFKWILLLLIFGHLIFYSFQKSNTLTPSINHKLGWRKGEISITTKNNTNDTFLVTPKRFLQEEILNKFCHDNHFDPIYSQLGINYNRGLYRYIGCINLHYYSDTILPNGTHTVGFNFKRNIKIGNYYQDSIKCNCCYFVYRVYNLSRKTGVQYKIDLFDSTNIKTKEIKTFDEL